MEREKSQKSSVRRRADEIKQYRCKNLVAVIEEPNDIKNIGTVIRNVNALGVDKTYVVDSREVSDLAVERSEMCTSIPMFGMIESLNLGTTSGIVLYEVTKQRREYQRKYKRAGKRRPRSPAK